MKIKIFTRSLKNSTRREFIGSEIAKLGDFEFWDNTHYSSEEFMSFLKIKKIDIHEDFKTRIAESIGMRYESSENEILSPAQVANFYSMIKLFKHIDKENYKEDFIIITEDDIVVKDYAKDIIFKNIDNIDCKKFILSLGWGKNNRNKMDFLPTLKEKYRIRSGVFRFSNPCFLTNMETIRAALEDYSKSQIDVPCDVWFHKIFPIKNKNVKNLCLYPALIEERSYSGSIDSEICPKISRVEHLIREKEYNKAEELRAFIKNHNEISKKFWRENYGY